MELINVKDIVFSDIQNKRYDLAFFSCGYENRAITISKTLNHQMLDNSIVLLFGERKNIGNRQENEAYFNSFENTKIELNFDNEEPIYDYLNHFLSQYNKKELHVLIDYSSMSRLWYVSILNWAKFVNLKRLEIDFIYSVGSYKDDFTPLVIEEIHTLPGHEGITALPKTVSIFGLGFDSMSTLCVLDKLEPSIVHSFIAEPIFPDYKGKTELNNKDFLDNYSEPVLYFPLNSVEKTYRLMSELISPYKDRYNISFIPMGPKPHVLATAILSFKFTEIINLYVKGKRESPPNVYPSGEYICTNIVFES
jgi:hypothetical protein